jgi:two-component system LytT family sensor kinase
MVQSVNQPMICLAHLAALLPATAPGELIRPAQTPQELLLTLLVRVAAIAAMASMLARMASFKRVLFREERTLGQQSQLGAFFGLAFGLGVATRVLLHYKAPDLGLEGSLLAGLLGGPLCGVLAGGIISLPALLNGEWVTTPALLLVGALGAAARRISPEVQEIWHFSPFLDLNIYRWYQRRFGKPRGDWQMLFFVSIVLLQIAWFYLGRTLHGHLFYWDTRGVPVDQELPIRLFYLDSPSHWMKFAIIVASIACVALPIKIWNNTRNEMIVEEQRRLLVEARLAALATQISPHFLFNTLNSISSLIRVNPEMARAMIGKLASILRRLLKRQDAFALLSDEMELIDDYLHIEVVRFGRDKLKIVKEIEHRALAVQVPSMILQPLIENSIKHGLSSRLAGGRITIRAWCSDGRLHLEVEDNGAGMNEETLRRSGEGIGLSNVRERLAMLYGNDCVFRMTSAPGQGTRVEIELPEIPELDIGRAQAAGA